MAIDPREFYRNISDYDDYFADQLHSADWLNSTQQSKEQAAWAAARTIDNVHFKNQKKKVYDALVAAGGESAVGVEGDILRQNTDLTTKELRAVYQSQLHQFPRDEDGDYGGTWVQEVGGAPAGTFTLTFNGQTTAAIDSTDINLDVSIQVALDALTNVDPGDVVVTDLGGSQSQITLAGQYSLTLNNKLTIDDSSITNGFATLVMVSDWGIPNDIFYAAAEEAINLIAMRLPDQQIRNLVLTSGGVASNRTSMDRARAPQKHIVHRFTSPFAWQLVEKWVSRNHSFNIKRI